MTVDAIYRPGFQGSHTTRAEVVIYQHGDDPIVISSDGAFPMDGKSQSDKNPSLFSVSTTKVLGEAAGSFLLTLKPSEKAESLFNRLVDDDWVDIIFYEFDKPYHVMRGLLDEIRNPTRVGKGGATVKEFVLSGADFGKIWSITPIWFSPYADNDLSSESVSRKIFDGILDVFGDPATASFAFMKDFLEATTQENGANWNPPKGMPNIVDGSFINSVRFNSDNFQNEPPRINFNNSSFTPQGQLWDLAKQYSDPMLTELWVDILPNGNPYDPSLSNGSPLDPRDSRMTVIMRDKPFPFQTSAIPNFRNTWNNVPVTKLRRQDIVSADIGRSGYERYNAYYVASLLHQEAFGDDALQAIGPLIDLQDIKRHGLRRMDVQINTNPRDTDDKVAMCLQQRELLRDWYCLNPYLLNGNLVLGRGRPDIRIGTRVQIPGTSVNPAEKDDTETYYVESVSNQWQFGAGTRTTLGVTRGWLGTEADYLKALSTIASRYKAIEGIKG